MWAMKPSQCPHKYGAWGTTTPQRWVCHGCGKAFNVPPHNKDDSLADRMARAAHNEVETNLRFHRRGST